MADFFTGGSGSTSSAGNQTGFNTSSTSLIPGAFESSMKNLYGSNIQDLMSSIGGLGALGRNQSQYAPLDPMVNRWIQSNSNLALSNPYYTPQIQSGMNDLQGMIHGIDPQAIQTIQQLLSGAMAGPNSLENSGLNTLQSRMNPQALTDAAQRYMSNIVSPSALAQSQAGGMGGARGGALQEMLAKYGAGMALPIAQMIQQASGEYGNAQMGMGSNLANRQSTLATLLEQMRQGQSAEKSNLINQNAGLSMQDQRIPQMQLNNQAIQSLMLPTMLSMQDMNQLRGFVSGMMPRVSLPPETTTLSTANSSGNLSNNGTNQTNLTLGSLLGPLSSIAAAGLLGGSGAGSAIGSGAGGAVNWLRSLLSGGANGTGLNSSGVDPRFFSSFTNAGADFGGGNTVNDDLMQSLLGSTGGM